MSHTAQKLAGPECLEVAKVLAREVLRFDLSKQQLIVLLLLIELSYGWGNEAVRVPKLELLSQLTGMKRTHVAATLRELFQMRIVEATRHEQAIDYRVLPDLDRWGCRPRVTPGMVTHATDWLRLYNIGPNGMAVLEELPVAPLEMDFPEER